MNVRVTEQRCVVEEVSYDVEVPVGVTDVDAYVMDNGPDWQEVHREVVRQNTEVTSIEPTDDIDGRIVAVIERLRRDDSDFITPETLRAYTPCTTEQARRAIVSVFGQDWLDRQDEAERKRKLATDKRGALLWRQDARP